MNGLASYERRKKQKQVLRAERGIPAVEWNIERDKLADISLPPPGSNS